MTSKQFHTIEVRANPERVTVELEGAVVADSHRALTLNEGSLPPRQYLPRVDVRMDLLEPSQKRTHCPFKGDASYFSARVEGRLHEDVAWTYEDPLPERADIAGLVCFY